MKQPINLTVIANNQGEFIQSILDDESCKGYFIDNYLSCLRFVYDDGIMSYKVTDNVVDELPTIATALFGYIKQFETQGWTN